MKKVVHDFKKVSIFTYIVLFSAIVVLIILLMGGYLYRFYYHTIYEDFKDSNEKYITALSARHENDLNIVNDIVLQMGISKEDTEFILEEQPLKSIALEKHLYQYNTVSQFFHQLYYFYHKDGYLYNNATSTQVDRFLNEGMLLENTTPEQFRQLIFNEQAGMRILREQKVSGYLNTKYSSTVSDVVVYVIPVAPKNTSTMIFAVSDLYYDQLLNSNIEEKRNDYIIYNDEIIVQRGEQSVDQEALRKVVMDSDTGTKRISNNGQKYLLTIQNGKSGLQYCTVQSMDIFQKKIITQQWGILFLLLICSVPASLCILKASKSVTKKVRDINALLAEDEESRYDLSHIETGIRSLVESNKEAAKENIPLRKTKFISSFIRNEYPDRKSILLVSNQAGLAIDYPYFLVILMGDRGNSNESKAHEEMLKLIAQQKQIEGYGINLINNNQSLFVLFGNETEALLNMTNDIFSIGKDYCEDFIMSISNMHEDFTEASQAYLEAVTAYDNRFLVDNSKVIDYTDIGNKEYVELLPEIYLQRLKNAIRSGNEADAKAVISEICECLASENQSLLTFRILYNDIIHMLITEWNLDQTDFKNIYSVFTLSQCLTIKDFNDILCEVCTVLLHNRTMDDKKCSLATEAISYMREHYHNPELNMTSLAEYLQVSPVTLAVEFKNEMAISPSDYLAVIRMEKAKELLKKTQLRVKEISLAVGYEDDHVFMRRFKKYVGKTPIQYRNNV